MDQGQLYSFQWYLTLLKSDDEINVEDPFDKVNDDDIALFCWGKEQTLEVKCGFSSSAFKPEPFSGHLNVLDAALYATESLLLILELHGGAEPKLLRLLFSFIVEAQGFGLMLENPDLPEFLFDLDVWFIVLPQRLFSPLW